MKRTQRILVVGAALLLLPTACTSDSDEATSTSAPETTIAAPDTTSTTVTTGPVVPGADEPGCIACHTNEAVLRALAVEPVADDILSEGEG